MPILYVETNFPMSIALGRDPDALALLDRAGVAFRLVIPSICFMEALSANRHETWIRKRFRDDLERQMVQIARNLISPSARVLLAHVEQASIELGKLLNETHGRFQETLGRLGRAAEIVELAPTILEGSLQEDPPLLDDPTDNLVLGVIRGHARAYPADPKAFLSGNSREFGGLEARRALREAGVDKYFIEARNALGWLHSQSRS